MDDGLVEDTLEILVKIVVVSAFIGLIYYALQPRPMCSW